jgi:hypothetical protein
MDELKNPEERNDTEKSARWLFSKELTEAWERLEEHTRQRPGPHLLVALVVGYFLQLFPFRSLLMLFLKLCVILTRPVLLLVCAFQLVKHLSKSSNSDAVPS